MEIKVKHISSYVEACVSEGQTTIHLGLLNDSERDDLAKILINAVYDIGPQQRDACAEWFAEILDRCGIILPEGG